jgi:hypothetical protein
MSARRKPAKRRAEKPVDGETRRARSRTKVSAEMSPVSQVRRAAKRAGTKGTASSPPEPCLTWEEHGQMNVAEQMEALLRQVGHTDDAVIAKYLSDRASELDDRVGELGGTTIRASYREAYGWRLIRTTELLSEVLAALDDKKHEGGLVELLRDASLHVWKLRWELGVLPNDAFFVLNQGEEKAS